MVNSSPAWRRRTEGERRLPVAIAVAAAIILQLVLPSRLGIQPKYLVPALETALLIALTIANPGRLNSRSRPLRLGGLTLIALVILANGFSAALLINDLLYWEVDRGGPAARAHADIPTPDFMFPQMTNPHLAPLHWEPCLADYLYLSLTNATAFSPTDTMPLTVTAKVLMGVQSSIALITVGLAIARVANILQ